MGRTSKGNGLKFHSLNPDFPKAKDSGLVCQGDRNPEVSAALGRERTLKQDVTRKTKGQLTITGVLGDLYGRLSA